MILTPSVGFMLYACSAIYPNLPIYTCIGSSDCLSWVSLCFAMVALSHSENLSLNCALMGNQLNPLDTSSLIYLCRVPLEVASATFTGFLSQIVVNWETSSNHMPNSCGFLPSQYQALLR